MLFEIDRGVVEAMIRSSRWRDADDVAVGVVAPGDFSPVGKRLGRHAAGVVVYEGLGSVLGVEDAFDEAVGAVCWIRPTVFHCKFPVSPPKLHTDHESMGCFMERD